MSTPTQVPFPMPDVLVRNWKWLVGIGVLLVVMGVFAILAPFLASVAINAWIGVAFLLAGIAQVAQSFGRGGWREALGHLSRGEASFAHGRGSPAAHGEARLIGGVREERCVRVGVAATARHGAAHRARSRVLPGVAPAAEG